MDRGWQAFLADCYAEIEMLDRAVARVVLHPTCRDALHDLIDYEDDTLWGARIEWGIIPGVLLEDYEGEQRVWYCLDILSGLDARLYLLMDGSEDADATLVG